MCVCVGGGGNCTSDTGQQLACLHVYVYYIHVQGCVCRGGGGATALIGT